MTDEKPDLLISRREEAAAAFVQATGKRMSAYRSLLRNLPLLLRQHGLGQTLAYLQARGGGRAESPYQVLYKLLESWLREQIGLPAGDILAILTGADSHLYRLASEEAGEMVLALRRVAARGQAVASEPD